MDTDSAPALRKLAHFCSFGLLALLLRWGLGPVGWRPAVYAVAFGITPGYPVGDEYHQSNVPGRYGAAGDVVIDAVGALMAWWFAESLRSRFGLLGWPRGDR